MLLQVGGELGSRFVSINAGGTDFLPIPAKEQDGGGAGNTETGQQGLVFGVVGEVQLQPGVVAQQILHVRLGEVFMFHLDAGGAPVGVEIQHDGLLGAGGHLTTKSDSFVRFDHLWISPLLLSLRIHWLYQNLIIVIHS